MGCRYRPMRHVLTVMTSCAKMALLMLQRDIMRGVQGRQPSFAEKITKYDGFLFICCVDWGFCVRLGRFGWGLRGETVPLSPMRARWQCQGQGRR